MTTIAENIERIRERIDRAAVRAGVAPETVRLIAVSKTMPVERMEEAILAGVTDVGENRVQEATEKYERIRDRVRWHLIGHLQTNKARHAVRIFDMIHSVDNLALGEELSRRCAASNTTLPILVQVKTSEEDTKSGVAPDQAPALIAALATLPHLAVQGLMTIPAFTPDPEDARPAFRRLRMLSEQIQTTRLSGVEMRYLSMGMTHDFEIAIEEGSNLVRIGTAIFGVRAAGV